MIGCMISHYRVLEKLGEGGMGVVYKAEDTKLNRPVALKFLPPGLTLDPEARRRFLLEARAAAALNHPNIVTVYEIDEHEGKTFMAMEYLEGCPLHKRLADADGSPPLPLSDALDIAMQAADGLDAAHARGIVHRDIKPANLFITRDGRVKILDFGIAKLAGGQTRLTQAGATLGTVRYMSPEQALGGAVDARSDLWSLGVVLYEMLAGRPPFAGDYPQAVIYAILNEAPAPLPAAAAPHAVAALVMRLLAKPAPERPRDAREVLEELRRFGNAPPATERITATGERPRPAIAVLPFKNVSSDPGSEYFGDGLAEDLINTLTQIRGLRVAARSSAFQFKGREMDVREIGRQLGVDQVLEGSVRKAGKKLRVTAQLVHVADGFHLWSERFDRQQQDIFSIQDDISLAIVDKLRLTLLAGERERVVKRHTQDNEAYDLFLKGRFFFNRRGQGDTVKAVAFFQRAIDKDPIYPQPYVGIADAFNVLGIWGVIAPRLAYAASRELLARAMAVDDTLAEAYASLATITVCHDLDFAAAERHYRRAIELNPHSGMTHAWYATMLGSQERFAEALDEARLAVEAEPLLAMAQAINGVLHVLSGQTDRGREILRRQLAQDPEQPMIQLFLGIVSLVAPALPDQAIHSLSLASRSGVSFALGWLGLAQAMAGQRREAEATLARLEELERENFLTAAQRLAVSLNPALRRFRPLRKKYSPPLLKALVYLGLERVDEALAGFEESFRQHDFYLPVLGRGLINLDVPWLDKVRTAPRFLALWPRAADPFPDRGSAPSWISTS
jgi:serine/threonine protein kinase/tetratricopeptide (TPR) repeat protein